MYKELAMEYLKITEAYKTPSVFQRGVLSFIDWVDNKYPELDEPTEGGWWWFRGENRFYPCYIKDGIIQDFIHPMTFSLDKYLKSYKGKWQKAIVSE